MVSKQHAVLRSLVRDRKLHILLHGKPTNIVFVGFFLVITMVNLYCQVYMVNYICDRMK